MPSPVLTSTQQAQTIKLLGIYLKQSTSLDIVRAFYALAEPQKRAALQYVAQSLNLHITSINRWFYKSFSQCAFTPLDDFKVEILQLIIDLIPNYTNQSSLTTFIRDKLLYFQEQNTLHAGAFYDYIYLMCGKFAKSKNQIARLQIELDLMKKQQERKAYLDAQKKVIIKNINEKAKRIQAACNDSKVEKADSIEKKPIHAAPKEDLFSEFVSEHRMSMDTIDTEKLDVDQIDYSGDGTGGSDWMMGDEELFNQVNVYFGIDE